MKAAGGDAPPQTTEEPIAKSRPRRARRDKNLKTVRANSRDTLWELKGSICREFNVIPGSQQIRVFNPQTQEKVLLSPDQHESTLKELNITRSSVVHVWTIPYDDDAATNSQPSVELGFTNTALGGGRAQPVEKPANVDVVLLSP